MMHHESKISSTEIYRGHVFRVTEDQVLLENEKQAVREIVHHNGGVCVAALDKDDNLLFVRQFRYALGEEVLELPAGKREKDEDPALCGIRELEEETGYQADSFRLLTVMYPTVGYCSEIIHIYLAEDLHPTHQHLDEDEFLDVEKIPFQTALEMVLRDEIPDAKTQLAILKIYALRNQK
ncbi:MAG: NUDIX hydrolase [Ruminococcaceae bacterium]|nr:NUDIX hydrolase [Oscillospiraceae bacterium]